MSIVGVARGTSAMTVTFTGRLHLPCAQELVRPSRPSRTWLTAPQGLPHAHAIVKSTLPKSKNGSVAPSSDSVAFLRFGRLRLGTVSEFTVLIQCCGLRVNYSPGPSMPLWTFRRGFLPTPVGRHLVFLTSTDKGVGQRGWRARGGAEIKIVRCVSEDPDILDDP